MCNYVNTQMFLLATCSIHLIKFFFKSTLYDLLFCVSEKTINPSCSVSSKNAVNRQKADTPHYVLIHFLSVAIDATEINTVVNLAE